MKKAAQDEQLRIAADRRKRQQEEKEREEEAAKKKREREEKARKEREAREKEAKDKERRDKEERAAKEKAEKEMLAKEKADKAEKEKLLKEAREGAEKERLLQLEEDRIEKARLEETARKERGAGEQAKILAVQQAQRERAQLEKASAERAAADRVAQEKLRSAVPVRSKATPRNGPAPQTTPPLDHPSPIKASSAIRPPTVRTQKTPQPFFPQPMPTTASFPARTPQQSFAPGLRPAFPSQSPIFSQVQTNAISPNPPTRGFPTDSSPPFELLPRTAPIGMGFPPVKSARMASVDETFSPSTAPIGAGPRAISGELIGDFRREPAPIGPPGPIGRPAAAYLDQPSSSTSTMRSGSPAPPDQVFGSAALGADDEIVQPARRNLSNGWDASVAAAPGAGRWSANPSIWGNSVSSEASGSSWGGSGVPTRQPSFGGISGVPTPFGTPGPNGFPGLFSPPGQQPPPQQHHSHH